MKLHIKAITPSIALTVSAIAALSPAAAQVPDPEERACVAFTREPESEGLSTVYASCWGTGFILGTAEQFRSYINLEFDATVVELERGEEKRVLLLRELPNGEPIVEDLEMPLALAGGRTLLAGIDGLSFDFTHFSSAGVIGVDEEPGQALPELEQTEGSDLNAGDDLASQPDGLASEELTENSAVISSGQLNVPGLIASVSASTYTQAAE